MDGIIVINKEPGMTSHDVVQKARRITGEKKCGHTGTLDPGACGVLPLCFGKATRVSEYVLAMRKKYRAELKLGEATDTEDSSGKVTERCEVPVVTRDHLDRVFSLFLGEIMQVPPMYSAVRKDGKKLYELARKGHVVERKPRPVHIYRLEAINIERDRILFDVECSSGTYVRTLCAEIARKLGTCGHMSYLQRTAVGPFTLEKAVTLDKLQTLHAAGRITEVLLPVDAALVHLPSLVLNETEAKRIAAGAFIPAPWAAEGTLFRLYGPGEELLAVAQAEKQRIKPRKVFQRPGRE